MTLRGVGDLWGETMRLGPKKEHLPSSSGNKKEGRGSVKKGCTRGGGVFCRLEGKRVLASGRDL